jgi:hypothetical protein
VSIRIAMPLRTTSATFSDCKAEADGDTSGLTPQNDRPVPVLFGNANFQKKLIEIACSGSVRIVPGSSVPKLVSSGLCVSERSGNHLILRLNANHPAINEIRAVLADILRAPVAEACDGPTAFDEKSPLGHVYALPFRVALTVLQADTAIDLETLRRRLPDVWPGSVSEAVDRMRREGVLDDGNIVQLDPRVPASYRTLVLRLAALSTDRAFSPRKASGKRAHTHARALDGAARLFGPDARMRNLIALAVYGPMHYADLRRVTGAYHLHVEGEGDAPFGRGGVVRSWETEHGLAVALDESYPLARPLLQLLVRLANAYPPNPHVPAYARPDVPPPQAWHGERLALFGSAIPTKILLTLGNRGWTFEAICCETATSGRDKNSNKRVVTKKVVKRLEDEGVLSASRARGPGFGPRLLRIADDFPAREELIALIDAAIAAWPDLGQRVQAEFYALPAKTKEYFRRPGLWVDEHALD